MRTEEYIIDGHVPSTKEKFCSWLEKLFGFSKSICVGVYCNRTQDLSNLFSSNNGFRPRDLHLESFSIPRCKALTAEWKNCPEILSGDNFLIYKCLQLCIGDSSFAFSLRDVLG